MREELENMLQECSEELDDIEQHISKLPLDRRRQYLTRYALIKSCGTLEFVYRSIVVDYFTKLSEPKIDHYLNKTIRQSSHSAKYDNMKS